MKDEIEIKVWQCVCAKCDYAWITKNSKVPKVCPNCTSRNWDKDSVSEETPEQIVVLDEDSI